MSQLKFWSKQNSNKQDKDKDNDNANSNSSNGTNDSKNGNKRNWLHTPEALMNGHVVYLVKFFGNLHVDQPKGIEVVKDAIRKLQFAQQMKKADTGTQEKLKKLEITISVDGVAIQEPRTQKILHQFPLHNISYCTDEMGVKKFFSFIAKTAKTTTDADTTNGMNGYGVGGSISNGSTTSNAEEQHECFVFISNKLASDITLTIGQAFELAYRKYVNNNEKSDLQKAHQQIHNLEKTIAIYKNRLRELSVKLPKNELDALLFKMGVKDIVEVPPTADVSNNGSMLTNGNAGKLINEDKLLIDTNSTKSTTSSSGGTSYLPIVPPRNSIPSQILNKSNSQKMDELLLNSDSDSDFDPRADEVLDSGGSGSGSVKNISNDLFGFEPTKSYGQQLFFTNNNDTKLQNHNNNIQFNNLLNTNNSNHNNNNSSSNFSNELIVTPPLLAPPPKVAAPRRSTSVPSNATTNNGNTDLFGSDPFDINGPSIFKNKVNIDDFSLESLDPLRK